MIEGVEGYRRKKKKQQSVFNLFILFEEIKKKGFDPLGYE